MPFIAYLGMLLVAAATVVFGLDLATAPLPSQKPETTKTATASAPAGPRIAAAKQIREIPIDKAEKQALDDKALSPVYPARPAGPTTTGQASSEPAPAEPAASTAMAAAPQAQAVTSPAPAVTQPQAQPQAQPQTQAPAQMAAAPASPSEEPSAVATAVSTEGGSIQRSGGFCDVSACAATYRSFRESDCSYQPANGMERRACTRGGSSAANAAPVSRPAPRRTRDAELRDVERAVRTMTDRAQVDDDDFDDRPARRRVYYIERDAFWR